MIGRREPPTDGDCFLNLHTLAHNRAAHKVVDRCRGWIERRRNLAGPKNLEGRYAERGK